MAGAFTEYASYLVSPDSWALGRFVVPAARLDELAVAAAGLGESGHLSLGNRVWAVSAVIGADVAGDVDRVRAYNASHAAEGRAGRVQSVELRAPTPDAIAAALRVVPDELERFVEIPITGEVRPLVQAIASAGAWAKVRTGGTSVDAFPASEDLVRFLSACVAEGVPFKATAGLHHPVRGEYALTYAPNSARGTMYGFLNVLLAVALLRAGEPEAIARAAVEERQASAFELDEAGVTWRGYRLTVGDLFASRDRAVRSFGSCSFREPIDDLTALGML